jgi:hypothetical protein
MSLPAPFLSATNDKDILGGRLNVQNISCDHSRRSLAKVAVNRVEEMTPAFNCVILSLRPCAHKNRLLWVLPQVFKGIFFTEAIVAERLRGQPSVQERKCRIK